MHTVAKGMAVMLPLNSSMSTVTKIDEKPDEEGEEHNLWLKILSQVQESSPNKLRPNKALIVLGDNESGKTSLIAKIQGNVDPKKGSGLEYHSIIVRDEYRDDHTRLGVWVLDGDPWYKNLLKFVLNEETFGHTTVVLTAAMTQPWTLLDSLQNWASILEEHIERLRLPSDVMSEYKKTVLRRFRDYLEPGDEIDGVTSPLRQSVIIERGEGIPLDENALGVNIGLDIIVVVTKTDYMSVLEKDFDYKEEHFDFIQQAVRKFCLKYGASLFYVSVKEDKNCDLLSKYLVHRIYSFPFKTPALVVEKDGIFIPSGWDNEKKISILYESLATVSPDDFYNEVIVRPIMRKPLQREAELVSEEDQSFLSKQQSILSQQPSPSVGRPIAADSPIRSPAGVQKTADRRLSGSPGVQASPKKVDGKPGVAGGEGVLQNFFNSLLNRRPGPPMGTPVSALRTPDRTSVRHDAAVELDRMTRSKKPSVLGQSPESSLGNSDDGGSSQT